MSTSATKGVPVLRLSSGFLLPLETVTERTGILGVSGSGKTTTASSLAEELLKVQLPLVIIDPTSAWWGLRSSKDGKRVGFPITILGGDHGDLPLEESAGKVIADLVATEAPPLVLDLSNFSKGAMRRFVTDFAERLYQKNRTALHVILDEADEFAPQRVPKDGLRLFGAIDNLVRRGRIKGIGVTMVCQRSAAINKDILSQCSTLIAHRASHPRDLEPILEWMKVHATREQLDEVHSTIAKLANGEAWVMSPQLLEFFGRVQMRDRDTFNSSATPKAGERRIEPKNLAAVDLAKLQERMAETIERAAATDPMALQRRVAELEAKLKAAPAKVETVEVRVPMLTAAEISRIEKGITYLDALADKLEVSARGLRDDVKAIVAGILEKQPRDAMAARRSGASLAPAPRASVNPRVVAPRAPAGDRQATGTLAKGELAALTAIAQHADGASRELITVLTGYKRSTRDLYLQRLVRADLVSVAGDSLFVTAAGRAALGDDFQPLPTGAALRQHWLQKLPAGERAVLEVLIAAHPGGTDREAISAATSYRRSTRDLYLQKLTRRRLVTDAGRGQLRASDTLFEGA